MLALVLLMARIFVRQSTVIPTIPKDIKPVEQKLAHVTDSLPYFLMLFVPAIGYVFSSSGGYPVPFFA